MPLVRKSALAPKLSQVLDWRAQVELLKAGSPDERWSAARALASELRAVSDLDAALAGLTDKHLQEAIFTSIAMHNCAESFTVLLRHLRSDDAQVRSFALDAMRLMPELAASNLPALLTDDDPDIRVLACQLSLCVPPGIANPLLRTLLTSDLAVNACAAAIEALAVIGGSAELACLEICAARFPSEHFISFAVRTASEQILARGRS